VFSVLYVTLFRILHKWFHTLATLSVNTVLHCLCDTFHVRNTHLHLPRCSVLSPPSSSSSTTADSYLEASSREAGAAAKLAASNKVVKYAGLSSQGEFVPIAVESHGPINRDALQFLSELGS